MDRNSAGGYFSIDAWKEAIGGIGMTPLEVLGGLLGFAIYIILFLGAAFIYWLPAHIANKRRHPNALPIALLTLFLGWTLVGWVTALVWATMATPAPAAPTAEKVADQ